MADIDVPDFGAIFTFGKSGFADNIPSHFFIRNDPIVEISCGEEHTAVVCTNGRLFVFGSNEWGQLGLGHRDHVNKPSCVKTLKPEKVVHVACGINHTIVSVANGKVYACGCNKSGQLGIDNGNILEYVTIPTFVMQVNEGVLQLSVGAEHSALLTKNGSVYIWGRNSQGQLGLSKSVDNSREIYFKPTLLQMNKVSFICCGYYHTGFITEDKLYVCGNNESGQLGIDLNKRKLIWTPQETPMPGKPTSISFGYHHSTALVGRGKVYVCGDNSYGQLGVYGVDVANEWTLLKALNNHTVTQVSCGNNHTMFITDKSELFCCGDTRYGKLVISDVDSTPFSITVPEKITDPFSRLKIIRVECGGCHSMIMACLRQEDDSEAALLSKDDEPEKLNSDIDSPKLNADDKQHHTTVKEPIGELTEKINISSQVAEPNADAKFVDDSTEEHQRMSAEDEVNETIDNNNPFDDNTVDTTETLVETSENPDPTEQTLPAKEDEPPADMVNDLQIADKSDDQIPANNEETSALPASTTDANADKNQNKNPKNRAKSKICVLI